MESKYEYDVSLIIPTYAVTKKNIKRRVSYKIWF